MLILFKKKFFLRLFQNLQIIIYFLIKIYIFIKTLYLSFMYFYKYNEFCYKKLKIDENNKKLLNIIIKKYKNYKQRIKFIN